MDITKFKQCNQSGQKKHNQNLDFSTSAVRSGITITEQRENCEPIFLTSGFNFENAEQAYRRFSNQEDGNVYSRFTNPSVSTFETRMAALEDSAAAIGFASGMGAITTILLTFLESGDEVAYANNIFGTTQLLFSNYFLKFGIKATAISLDDQEQWQQKITNNTKLVFIETPSNPTCEVIDIQYLAKICDLKNALLVVDNCFCTPAIQQPLYFGADITLHSATKFLDGQGRTLGGAVCANQEIVTELRKCLRNTGNTLSAFNAWILTKSLETLNIRMFAQSDTASKIAKYLQEHKQVEKVFYPFFGEDRQVNIARKQQRLGGAMLSFILKDADLKTAFKFINNTSLASISGNLGDTKTLITNPYATTHCRLSDEQKWQAKITPNLIRLSIGLESLQNLQQDLEQAFASIV